MNKPILQFRCRLFLFGLLLCGPAGMMVADQEASPLCVDVAGPGRYALDACDAVVGALSDATSVQAGLASARRVRQGIRVGEKDLEVVRTWIEVRGRHPYRLLFEDYPALPGPVRLERAFDLAPGAELTGFRYDQGGSDVWMRGATGETQVLRVLQTGSEANSLQPPGMRIGEPAMEVHGRDGQPGLVVPAYSARPRYRLMLLDNPRELPTCTWLVPDRVLQVEWREQVDEFRVEVDEAGLTRFLLERKRGEMSDEVVSFGIPYTPPVRTTGRLIGHWSFDDVKDRTVKDSSGNGFHGELLGGVRLMPGISGMGIDGVSCGGVDASELVVPTSEGILPGELSFGSFRIPGEVMKNVSNRFSLSFWYAMPATVGGVYHPYMAHMGTTQFTAPGWRLYSYNHWRDGQRITAEALGHHRLFGMIGPLMERDRWNHYVMVLNDKEGLLYINGRLQASQSGSKLLSESIKTFTPIEVLKDTWARMDEVRMFDYALDLDAVDRLYRMEGQERMTRLRFDSDPLGPIEKGVVHDVRGIASKVEQVELFEGPRGRALRFGADGGRLAIAPTISGGRRMDAVTFAAWVRIPTEHLRHRDHLLHSGTHGHSGMFLGFWNGNLWGQASQNDFKGSDSGLRSGEWTHVMVSYGNNRIQTWLNGEKVQDREEAYPSGKGWAPGDFTLAYGVPIEVADIQLFNFMLSDSQFREVFAGKDVVRPVEPQLQPDREKRVYTHTGTAAP